MIPAYKILRGSAWLLMLAVLVTILSGFGITKNFIFSRFGINYDFSRYLHTIIIPLILVPLFYVHSLMGFLNLIKRHKFLNRDFVKIGFSILWTALLVLFGWFYFAKNPSIADGSIPAKNNLVQVSAVKGENFSLTAEEINKHNSANGCWLIISGNVYDVTKYLGVHPGGAGAITPYCGRDASSAFATKNQGQPHSSTATNLLNSFYLGRVGETITSSTVQNVQSQPVVGGDGEDEAEFDD